MRGWKVLAATPLLLVPLAVLGLSIADGPEQKASTPVMVLPAATVEGPQVTMRRDEPRGTEDDTEKRGQDLQEPQPDPQPQPQPEPQPPVSSPPTPAPDPTTAPDCAPPGRDDDDDGVEFVHPCPGAVGDDEDDDDDDGDD